MMIMQHIQYNQFFLNNNNDNIIMNYIELNSCVWSNTITI